MVALSLLNGGLRWDIAVAQPKGATELERVADVSGNPWVSGREVCAVTFQGRVGCFDVANGQALWARDMSSSVGLSGDPRYLFVPDERGAVHALDRSNGTSFWKQDRFFLRAPTVPLSMGKQIVVADVEGLVHFMDRESGAFVARASTDSSGVVSPMIVIPGGVLVQTRNGGLFALGL